MMDGPRTTVGGPQQDRRQRTVDCGLFKSELKNIPLRWVIESL